MNSPKSHYVVPGIVIGLLWSLFTVMNMVILPKRFAPHVYWERVLRKPMPLIVRAGGYIEAKESITTRAQFDGPVITKKFREGQKVSKGDLLFVMGRDRIRLERQQKEDALHNAEADLLKARKDLRLQRMLFDRQAVAHSSVDDAQAALVKAEQGLRSAKETIVLHNQIWNSNNVYAAFDGTVVKDWVLDEKLIGAGKEIVTIADISEFTMKGKVDELESKQVHEGQPAEVKIQIFDKTPFQATVREVGSQAENNAIPEVPVVLALKSTPGIVLRPKLTAEGRITVGTTEPILSVPLSAVANADGTPRVWVVNRFGRLHAQAVDLGRTNPDRVEVTGGLTPGAQVCAEAEPDFADGMRVIYTPTKDAPGSSKTQRLMPKLKAAANTSKPAGGPTRPSSGPPRS